MATASPFTPALFDFFRDLKRNNEKPWFEANRDRYEEDVLEPSKAFVLAFRPRLREISEHFRAEPRVQGGSLFRIHQDLRFDPNRPPYKDHAGIQFRHAAGRDVHAPGFYLHLEAAPPGEAARCFVGVGMWRPDRGALRAVRDAIVADPDGWTAVSRNPGFRACFEPDGESLKRGPVGYDRDHPLIEDIKRKDFIAAAPLTEEEVTGDGFVELFADRCRTAAPWVRWLCGAVDVGF